MNKIFLIILIISNVYCQSTEYELKRRLLENYRKDSLPIINRTKVDVSLGIALRAINNINQIDGIMRLNIWFRYSWEDEYLKWNYSEYNLKSLPFYTDPSIMDSIWIPDIYLYNTASDPMSELAYTKATVDHNGKVLLSRPGIITSTCNFNLNNFPYDEQRCTLKFGSWSMNSEKLNLSMYVPVSDISNYQENQEWDMIKFNASINEKLYNCCPYPFQDITFEFIIRRKANYFNLNLILPAFTTAALMIMAQYIPWNSGERISFATTIVLTMTVFLLILSETLPKSNSNSLLGNMFIGLTMISFLGLLCTILITSLYSDNREKSCFKKVTIFIFNYFKKNEENSVGIERRISMDDMNSVSSEQNNSSETTFREFRNQKRNKFHKIAIYIEYYFTIIFMFGFIIFCLIMYLEIPNYSR